jgi:hypothetical protein
MSSVVLYGCENWSLTLRVEDTLSILGTGRSVDHMDLR